MSPMNAYRFLIRGVLRWAEIPEDRQREVLDGLKLEQVKELEFLQLIPAGSKSEAEARRRSMVAGRNVGAPIYRVDELEVREVRERVARELGSRTFTLRVESVVPERGFGLAKSPDFEGKVLFLFSRLQRGGDDEPKARDEILANVGVQRNRARGSWGFAVVAGQLIKSRPH